MAMLAADSMSSIHFPLFFPHKFANNVVHHEIDFIRVSKAVDEAEEYFVRCEPIGHQCVYATWAIAFLIDENSVGLVNGLERPNPFFLEWLGVNTFCG